MKTTYLIIPALCLLVLGAGTACTELEDQSYNRIIADRFRPAGDDLSALLGSAYVPWRQTLLLWNGVARAQMLPSDQDVIPARPNGWVDGGIYKRMHQHKWTSEDDVCIQSWERTYAGVNACNRVLYQIESGEIEVPGHEEAVIAELKVLRASYYYILVDLFGNIPLVTRFDVPGGFLPEQSTRQEVYDFIVSEITGNISLLSEETGNEYYGRFNKWAACTLLAKMYLNAGIFSGGAYAEWQKCIDACDQVIRSARYALEPEQRLVFVTNNENSKEIILGLAIDETYVTDWNAFDFHLYTLQPASQATYNFQASPWGGVCCIPQYIDTFDPDDERLAANFIQGPQYDAAGSELLCTMGSMSGQPLAYVNEVPSIDESQEIHGFRWGKFEYAQGITNRLSNDWPLFRYADVLLMKAEALLRSGRAEEAATIVTQVRERNFTGNPGKALVTAADLAQGSSYDYGRRDNLQEPTHEGGGDIAFGRMLDELGWEFSQEGRRRQDMIRFGAFTRKSWFSHDKGADDHCNLYPIPQKQLLANGNLKQNPGY